MTAELIRYDAMCVAIKECRKIDEIADLKNKAAALELYSKQAHNFEAERQCREIRIRAERQCGVLLKETVKRGGDRKSKSNSCDTSLIDAGITHDQSAKFQKLAAIPEDTFEKDIKADGVSTSSLIRKHFPTADILKMPIIVDDDDDDNGSYSYYFDALEKALVSIDRVTSSFSYADLMKISLRETATTAQAKHINSLLDQLSEWKTSTSAGVVQAETPAS